MIFAPNLPGETGPLLAARALKRARSSPPLTRREYNLSEEDVISLGGIHAIETINGISADQNDRIDSWYMLDVMLARGYRYTACATDDAHFFRIATTTACAAGCGSERALTGFDCRGAQARRLLQQHRTADSRFAGDRRAYGQDSLLAGRLDLRDRKGAHRVQAWQRA
ncbi:MAG: hypothetical protein U0521_29930 [Anaerolineae bacterium]